jgi:hypothetical protein
MKNEKHSESLLEHRLRSERPRFSPRAGFTERVMESLPAGIFKRSARSEAADPWLRFTLALGAAAAIALVVCQILIRRSPLPAALNAARSEQKADPAAQALKLPEISMAQVQELSAKLDEPLQNELKNVISDTRQAIQFVASNFLPDRPEN